jgi:hypothetical protein
VVLCNLFTHSQADAGALVLRLAMQSLKNVKDLPHVDLVKTNSIITE